MGVGTLINMGRCLIAACRQGAVHEGFGASMADKMNTVEDLMVTGLHYVLDFENKASDGAKKMAEATTDSEAKELFEKSATMSKTYAQRIEATFRNLGKPVETSENRIADAMLHEVQGMIQEGQKGPVLDAALIVAASQMQHYRMASYGSMLIYAKLIDKEDAAKGLAENLDDSKGGDEKLKDVAKGSVNPAALKASLQAA